MMGIDDMAVSFAISVGAGSVPNIISLIRGDVTLNDKIDKCFRKALDKWDVSNETRQVMRYDMLKHYTDLQSYLTDKTKGVHPKTKELLRLWVDELKNDDSCMLFMISHKQEIIECKIDSALTTLKYDILGKLDCVLDKQSNISDKIDQVISILCADKASGDQVVATKIESLLNGVIWDLIEELRVYTAYRIVDEIEKEFASVISKNDELNALLKFRKAQSLHWINPRESVKLYNEAYTLCPQIREYIEVEIERNIMLKNDTVVNDLLSSLNDNESICCLWKVINSEDPKNEFSQLAAIYRSDYAFRYRCLSILINRGCKQDITWLFEGVGNVEDFVDIKFSNIRSWLYALSYQRAKVGDYIFFNFEADKVPMLDTPLNVFDKFNECLCKTELANSFDEVRGIFCYWSYVKDHSPHWIEEFQKIDKQKLGGNKDIFDIMEASMLLLSSRIEEAFAKIVSMPFNLELLRISIMMSIHSQRESHVVWALEKSVEHNLSLTSEESTLLAHFMVNVKSSSIRSVLAKADFKNPEEKILLEQLSKYYEGVPCDESLLENNTESLNDTLKAYAALILAKNGKTKIAFEMLNPIVDDTDKCDIKKRVFLGVLMQMQEKQGDLYKILVKNREEGNYCDDDLLIQEYQLDSSVADFKNALAAITELYKRNSTDRNYIHYLITLGHVYPEQLKDHEQKVLSLSWDDTNLVVMLFTTLSENGYLQTACELLWRYVRTSEDYGVKMLYYNESMSGTLHSIVNEEFDCVDEGNYVLCDLDGQRKMYKASHQGSDIAKSLIGLKKDDVVSVEIGFEEKNVKIIAICNKYRKLAFDIMQESLDGSNPYMKPFKIDMNNPLESLESMMKKFTGDEMSPAEREKIAVEKYNRGDYSLMQMVDDVYIIAGYYKLLFTTFNVHTAPCREAVYKMNSTDLSKLEFVLDLPSAILFSEFTALRGTEINCKAKITSLLKEHINAFYKSPSRFMEADMFEAMQSKSIKHYSEYVDVDAKTHVEKLLAWVDSHCNVIIPERALPLITQGDRSPLKDEIIASLSTLLQPNYVFVTDDIKLKQMLPMVNIITTETFVKLFNDDSVSEEYSEFLFDCHFDGIDMSEGFMIDQYMKMSYQKENDFVRVIQNMMSNPLLIDRINNVGMKLVDRVIDIRLLRITLVNMYSMALKGLSPIAVDNIAQIAKVEMNVNIFAMQFVRQCLLDALFIVKSN